MALLDGPAIAWARMTARRCRWKKPVVSGGLFSFLLSDGLGPMLSQNHLDGLGVTAVRPVWRLNYADLGCPW